jgi:hypothetical protein
MSDRGSDQHEENAIEVRGGATADEIAAIAAVLHERAAAAVPERPERPESNYERWRRGRISALKLSALTVGALDLSEQPTSR